MTRHYDYIIVGAGSAGCVLAARLTEDPKRSVLLIEAGRDIEPGAEPDDILDVYPASYYNKDYMWPGQRAHWRTPETSSSLGLDQGKIVGGSGSVMGMIALRGTPDDYNEWEALGASGWGWEAVLPYFNRLETDMDFTGPEHGNSGPTTIRRIAETDWPPLSRAFRARAERLGLPFIADMNADFREGLGALPLSSSPERRSSSALDYLAEARSRSNLTILTNTVVKALVVEKGRVTGVRTEGLSEEDVFSAGEVIVSAGAIRSPALLLRSGIGPASELQALGFDVHLDRQGVGRNLQNHAILFMGGHLRPKARQSKSLRPQSISCMRFSSLYPGALRTDLYINVQSKSSWSALGQQIANLGVVLLKPEARGTVKLGSAAAAADPLVSFNFASTPSDMARLRHGFRELVQLATAPELQTLFGDIFPVRFSDALRRLNRQSRFNAATARMIAAALDLAPWLAGPIFGQLTDRSVDIHALVADDEALDAHIQRNIGGTFHLCGTCRMGAASDPLAVTGSDGKVHGIDGLRVADASIMPSIPRGNTNIPTLMLAEKIADAIILEP